jgi:hypothetical protein
MFFVIDCVGIGGLLVLMQKTAKWLLVPINSDYQVREEIVPCYVLYYWRYNCSHNDNQIYPAGPRLTLLNTIHTFDDCTPAQTLAYSQNDNQIYHAGPRLTLNTIHTIDDCHRPITPTD